MFFPLYVLLRKKVSYSAKRKVFAANSSVPTASPRSHHSHSTTPRCASHRPCPGDCQVAPGLQWPGLWARRAKERAAFSKDL